MLDLGSLRILASSEMTLSTAGVDHFALDPQHHQ